MVKPEKGLVAARLLVCKNHSPGLVHGSSSVQVSIITTIIIVIITIIIVAIITINFRSSIYLHQSCIQWLWGPLHQGYKTSLYQVRYLYWVEAKRVSFCFCGIMFDNNSDGQLPRRDRLGPRQGQKQGRRPSGQVSFFQIYFGWFSEKECGMPFAIFSLLFRLQKSLSEERIWYLVTYSPLLQILPFLFIVRLLRPY